MHLLSKKRIIIFYSDLLDNSWMTHDKIPVENGDSPFMIYYSLNVL